MNCMVWLEPFIIGIAAFVAAGLTFFSGFGLGTLLMPVLAIFFPVELAIMMTAVVHFINNLVKLAMLGRYANMEVVFRFGVPAFLAAMGGAWVLAWLSDVNLEIHYHVFGATFNITPIKMIVAMLLGGFLYLEFSNNKNRGRFQQIPLSIGGVFSGFFGGLSGHQGAFRSACLVQSGLTKEQFLGTNVVIACLVDLSRLIFYGTMDAATIWVDQPLVMAGILTPAILGTFMASRYIHTIAMPTIRTIIAVFLMIVAIGLGTGVL